MAQLAPVVQAQTVAAQPRDPVLAVVGLGANLGDAPATLRWACDQLQTLATDAVQCASLWRSAPVDASGPDFFNTVAQFHTKRPAPDLLQRLLAIELQAGRERPYRHAPRTLDLDLLFYGSAAIQSPQLTLPHPRWQERAFVLHPLAELQPGWVDSAMLQAVSDQCLACIGSFLIS